MKIKGRYVAQVVIDFDFDPEKAGTKLPFEEMCKMMASGELTEDLQKMVEEEFFDERLGTLTVDQMEANLYEVKEDE